MTSVEELTASAEAGLVQAVMDGDRSAFTELVKAHDARTRAVVFAMVRDANVLDDLLQDTYVKAFRKLGTFKRDARFGTWLHRIAVNTTLDFLRKNKKHSAVVSIDDETSSGPVAERFEDAFDSRVSILGALAALSERQRAVVLLIDVHGYDYRETARMVGAPVGTVGYLLNQARKSLKQQLDQREV